MRRFAALALLAGSAGLVAPSAMSAQENAFLPVGAEAPDIELVGATRHGVLRDAVRLSDYRGETVVLAFFFRARTRG